MCAHLPQLHMDRPLDYFVRHSAKEGQAEIFGQALENLLKGNSINWKNPQRCLLILQYGIVLSIISA